MVEMMKNPEIMRKAKEELEQVVGMDNMVEESHVPKLRCLDAVLKEVLRLHPPLMFLIPRSPNQTCTVGGYAGPKGTQVMVNTWAIHSDPEAWDNPMEFCLRGSINATSKWDYSGNDFRYIPFGSRRRICVGLPMTDANLCVSFALALVRLAIAGGCKARFFEEVWTSFEECNTARHRSHAEIVKFETLSLK